jgi:proprotein convertase subtilisin/kexin type 5
MKSIIALAILSLALLQAITPTQVGDSIDKVSNIAETDCSSIDGCLKCFMAESLLCYQCKETYIWETRDTASGQCWKYTPREISGYGRDCIVCNETNYPMDKKCYPCPFKCKACHYDPAKDAPVCDGCKSPMAGTPGYDVNDDCSCKNGLSIDDDENVKYCFCNDENKFTFVREDGKVGCFECDLCYRNFPNCKGKGECPTKTYDPLICEKCKNVDINDLSNSQIELSICCQDCDITCETCYGPGRDNCKTCRSEGEQLFEWIESEKQCMCVCHSKEVVDGDYVKCVCNDGREATQVDGIYQCLCKAGTHNADKADSDGVVACVPDQ